MLRRFEDWPTRLERYLASCESRAFRYGQLDCCLFVADAICAMTGVDPAQPFRANYTSRKEAIRAIRTYTGQTTVAAVAERVFAEQGLAEAPALAARRGDVALLTRGRDSSLAIVSLNGRDILALGAKGLWRMPIRAATRAWHV